MPTRSIFCSALLAAAALSQQPAWPDTALYGRVVDARHEGVPAARVVVEDEGGAVVGRAVADGDGWYQVRRLPCGALRVRAGGEGMVEASVAVASEGLVREATLRLEQGAVLSGVVRWSDGTPCADADVLVVDDTPHEAGFRFAVQATTDGAGRFATREAPLRALRVLVFCPGHTIATHVVGRGIARDRAIEITMPAGTLSPRRVEVHGLPAGVAAVVRCEPVAQGVAPASWLPRRAREATLGADGVATLWALPERHELRVHAPGFRSMPVLVPCRPGSTDGVRFTMSPLPADLIAPRTTVRGRLVDELGRPIGNAVVGALGDGDRATPCATGAAGEFTLDVPVREGVLCAFTVLSPGWRLAHPQSRLGADGLTWYSTNADPARPVVLHAMRAGRIVGVLLGPSGVPLAAARVELVPTKAPTPGAVTTGRVFVASDSGGRIDVPGLPPGRYELRMAHGSGLFGSAEVDVPPGGEVSPGDLAFPAGASVDGQVLDVDGHPFAAAALRIVADPRNMPAAFRGRLAQRHGGIDLVTGRDGRFHLPWLEEGAYVVFGMEAVGPGALAGELLQFEVVGGKPGTLKVLAPR